MIVDKKYIWPYPELHSCLAVCTYFFRVPAGRLSPFLLCLHVNPHWLNDVEIRAPWGTHHLSQDCLLFFSLKIVLCHSDCMFAVSVSCSRMNLIQHCAVQYWICSALHLLPPSSLSKCAHATAQLVSKYRQLWAVKAI